MKGPRNVRFWIYANGLVKLTLRPDQRLTWSSGGPTEEGYHSCSVEWYHDAREGAVYRTVDTDGRDCDGRLSTHEEMICPVADLSRMTHDHEGADPNVRWPDWTRVGGHQRDYTAEAMGY